MRAADCNDKAAQMAVTGDMDATNGNVAVTFIMPGIVHTAQPHLCFFVSILTWVSNHGIKALLTQCASD